MRLPASPVRVVALLGALSGAATAACARGTPTTDGGAGRAGEPAAPDPVAVVSRAVARAGGAEALGRARALEWAGDAVVSAGGRTVAIAGTWKVQPPDTAVVATYDVSRGPQAMRALVVAAPRGWIVIGDRVQPMPEAMLASERDEFYLYDVMRLLPLREPGVTLTAVAADSLGQPGVRVTRAGRPTVTLHVDGTGRLAHLRTEVRDPAGGAPVTQDVWLAGEIAADGVRWPRELRITQNGAPFFALTLRTLHVGPRVDDPRLAGPR